MVNTSRPGAQTRQTEHVRQLQPQAKAARRLDAEQRRAHAESGMNQVVSVGPPVRTWRRPSVMPPKAAAHPA